CAHDEPLQSVEWLLEQWRPCRVGRVARGPDLVLVAAGQVDRIEMRAAAAALAEIHQDAAVWRPGRALDEKILRQEPLARAVRPHNADIEGAALDLGEGDQIAARRPYRRAVFALAKADASPLAAAGIHHVELLRAAAIGVENDLAGIG